MSAVERIESKWDLMADNIIAAVEAYELTGKWEQPWKTLRHRNEFTGTVYKGINTWLLMMTPYECPLWGTFNQWSKAGYRVMKGASAEIVWSNPYRRKEDEDGNVTIEYGRSYPIYVFNAQQVEGFEWTPDTVLEPSPEIYQILTAKNPTIVTENAAQAYYTRKRDLINMPPQNNFIDEANYFGTLAHEVIHWSGHSSRLNRASLMDTKDRLKRAFEELVAEIGTAILGTELGFSSTIRESHFEYIKSWMTLLKSEKDALKLATSEALEAVRFIR